MPIHPTAIIDPQADVHPSADVGPYVVVEGPVRVGAGTVLRPHVHVSGHTDIGANCRIFSGAVVGEVPQDRAFAGGVSYCRVGDETVIREGVTIHRGTEAGSATTVGRRCFLMANSHVGHNCEVGDDVVLANGALLAGYVHVGCRAFISGNSAVHQFVRIGDLVMVGGLTKITQDVPPFFMVDDRGTCVGVNVIGLQRADFTAEERRDARRAYALIYRSQLSLPHTIERLAETAATQTGLRILEFLQSPSRRGIADGPRRAARAEATEPARESLLRAA